MTPEEKQLLKETAELTKENNKILRNIRRNNRIGIFLRIMYWVIILGLAFGSYYAIKPLLDPLMSGYGGIMKNIDNVKNITTNLPALSDWMNAKQ